MQMKVTIKYLMKRIIEAARLPDARKTGSKGSFSTEFIAKKRIPPPKTLITQKIGFLVLSKFTNLFSYSTARKNPPRSPRPVK